MAQIGLTILLGVALGVGAFSAWRPASPASNQPIPPVIATQTPGAQTFVMPVSQTDYLPIRDFNVPDPIVSARAALVIDARSNRALFAKQADQRLPVASITKLMTAIVILEHLDLDTTYAARAEDLNVDGKGADFHTGEKILGADLFKIMLVQSSNDATSIFARAQPDFVDLMNQKARELGMTETHFNDPAGLDDHATYSTASDVAKLIRAADRYPLIVDTLRLARADVRSADGLQLHHLISTNQLLGLLTGIIIGKTGNTDGARGTMALEVRVDGANALIAVVLGSEDRFGEMKKLIDWGKHAHKWTE